MSHGAFHSQWLNFITISFHSAPKWHSCRDNFAQYDQSCSFIAIKCSQQLSPTPYLFCHNEVCGNAAENMKYQGNNPWSIRLIFGFACISCSLFTESIWQPHGELCICFKYVVTCVENEQRMSSRIYPYVSIIWRLHLVKIDFFLKRNFPKSFTLMFRCAFWTSELK